MVDLVQTPPRAPGAPPSRPRRSRGPIIALLVLIIGALGAIGVLMAVVDNGPSSGPLSTGTSGPAVTSPTTIDPQAAVKSAILEAHRQSTDAFVAVASDPNGQPTDPRLEEHTIGNALLASQVTIDRLRKAGNVYRGSLESHPVVLELTSETALVEDCGVDRVGVFNAATGAVVTPVEEPPTGRLAHATYKLINGVWMQDSFKDLKQPCVPPAS